MQYRNLIFRQTEYYVLLLEYLLYTYISYIDIQTKKLEIGF